MKKLIILIFLVLGNINFVFADSKISYIDYDISNKEYLIKPLFKIDYLDQSKKIEIPISLNFLEKGQFNSINDEICLYSFSKDNFENIGKIGCNKLVKKSIKKLNIDTGKYDTKELIDIISFNISDENKNDDFYGIGLDFIDLSSIKFTSDKENYDLGESILIKSNIIKTINGNTVKNGTIFYLPDYDSFLYSSGGIIEFKTTIAKPGEYKIYFKYSDYTNSEINQLYSSNIFKINDGNYFNLSKILPNIVLSGSNIVVTFDKSNNIENVEFVFGDKSFTKDISENIFEISIDTIGTILFQNDNIPNEADITIRGYNINLFENVYTNENKIKLDFKNLKKNIKLINENKFIDENSYLTGITNINNSLSDIVDSYSDEEINNIDNLYKDEINKYNKNYLINKYKEDLSNIIYFIILYKYYLILFILLLILLFFYIKRIRKSEKLLQKSPRNKP